MCTIDEKNGSTPLVIQRGAALEDICSLCDKADHSYFPNEPLRFFDKDQNTYLVDPITLEIRFQDHLIDVKDLPVIAYHDYYHSQRQTEVFFIGNGDILHDFGVSYPRNMCGYLSMPFWANNVYLLSSGLLQNVDEAGITGPLEYPEKLYYLNIFD